MYINNKPIAILLAAYNAEKYLAEQVDSLLNQTNQEWMLYIRNDGSMDSTSEIIGRYCQEHSDKIIEVDNGGDNLGCRDNFFRLLEVVESDYYMFCDADDVWLPEKVQILLSAIQEEEMQYPQMPIQVFSDVIVCDSELNVIEPSSWIASGINPDKFLSYNYMAVCCKAGGACSILNNRVKNLIFPLVDNGLIYDFWIALNVAKYGKFKVIHKPLLYYRQHDDQVCGISYGEQNSVKFKLKNIRSLIKQYRWEAQHHTDFGYGPPIKYYWYKILTILKIRLS